MDGMNKDITDFMTKKQLKRLSKLDFETRKTFDELVTKVLFSFKCEFERVDTRYIQEQQDLMILVMAYTLKYVHGFGKKRLPEIVYHFWDTWEMLEKGDLNYTEIVKDLKDCGIILETHSLQYQHLFDDVKNEKEKHAL